MIYRFENYHLRMNATGNIIDGKHQVIYRLFDNDNNTIFDGNDYFPSPLFNNPVGKKSACTLIDFLTLRKGDTDDEYFESYTPEQIEFRDSMDECFGMDWIESIIPDFQG